MLNPQAKALLELIETLGAPPMNTLPVAEARAQYRDRRYATQPTPPEVSSVSDHQVKVGNGSIAARAYRPLGSRPDAVLPVLVYYHGGGWTIGDLDTHDTLCRSLANGAKCAVVSVDYRMGPEHRFPIAVDDSMAALRWVVANALMLGIDPSRVAVGGDSAGGNLAAVVSLLARDAGRPSIKFQLLIYPATDQRAQFESHRRNGTGYLLTAALMDWFRDQYHGSPDEYLDWRASPMLAGSHEKLPPALVLTAGYDPLVDEGQAYARLLAGAGVAVESICYEGQIHGFITMGKMIDEANEAVDKCAQALAKALGTA
ncbi:MAG: alpha/beta hydrolase [Burkholderiaceae bacterium]